MRIQRGESWWQLEIVVKREKARKIATYIKNRSERATVLFAFFALLVGFITLFYPWVWPVRMALSVITLVSAATVISRVVVVQPEPAHLNIKRNTPSIKRKCPECGTDLEEDPNTCPTCGWESDNPIDE